MSDRLALRSAAHRSQSAGRSGVRPRGATWLGLWLVVAISLFCGNVPARAAETGFYAGKTFHVLVGFGPGGGYDLYARTLGRYLGRHLPGNPTVLVQNMAGAGSLKVVNYLYNAAPRDGTVIATFARGIVFEPLIGHPDAALFEAPKFGWIGSISNEVGVCAFATARGIADRKSVVRERV